MKAFILAALLASTATFAAPTFAADTDDRRWYDNDNSGNYPDIGGSNGADGRSSNDHGSDRPESGNNSNN